MKTRNGFVSNSSSSSFCIYGAKVKRNIVDENKVTKAGLEVITGNPDYSDENLYIGRSWCNIKDDETGAQFKANIANLIKEMFGVEKCSTIEDAWYDG